MRRQVRQGESAGSAIRRCEPKRLTRMRKVKRKPLQSTTPLRPPALAPLPGAATGTPADPIYERRVSSPH